MVVVRRVDSNATIPIRHSVLWPTYPISHVILKEDEHGFHYAAVVSPGEFSDIPLPQHITTLERESEEDVKTIGNEHSELLSSGDIIVAIISLFLEPVPASSPSSADSDAHAPEIKSLAIRFRKFACLPPYRRKGIGALLLLESLQGLKRELMEAGKPVGLAWCDARAETKDWYERQGMRELEVVSFDEDGSTQRSPADRFWKGDVEYLRMVMAI